MDLPASVKGLTAMRLGVGVTALIYPAAFALVFGRPPAEARSPMATIGSTLFGVRELGLSAVTAGASKDEPRALKRILLVGAATDALDLALVGIRSIRQPGLRRAVILFAPASLLSVGLHLRAAQNVEAAK